MPNQLKVIKAPILSLVGNPSNKRWFYVKKEKGMKYSEKLESLFPEPDIEDVEDAVKESIDIMEEWKEDLPSEVVKSAGILIRTKFESEEDEDDKKSNEKLTLALKEINKKLSNLEDEIKSDSEEDEDEDEEDEGKSNEEEEEDPEEDEEKEEEEEDENVEIPDEAAKALVGSVRDSIKNVLENKN